MKSRIYHFTLLIVFAVHTYLLFPGFVIFYKIIHSRISPYSPENKAIHYWDVFLIFIVTYIVLYFLIKTAFYFPKSKKIRILTIFTYLFFFIFIYFNWFYIYNFNGWFENTFTTEMKVYWGPFEDPWQKPEPDRTEYFGPLKIGTYYPQYYVRLNKLITDIDKDDWILTTIGMFHIVSHWESHPVFLFCREPNIVRLEKFDRDKLNFLFNREISKNTIEKIFNGEDKINSKFIEYIMADSLPNESILLKNLYTKIDSLILQNKK